VLSVTSGMKHFIDRSCSLIQYPENRRRWIGKYSDSEKLCVAAAVSEQPEEEMMGGEHTGEPADTARGPAIRSAASPRLPHFLNPLYRLSEGIVFILGIGYVPYMTCAGPEYAAHAAVPAADHAGKTPHQPASEEEAGKGN
jgi:hypothetical protein